jgi:hypothetical protein
MPAPRPSRPRRSGCWFSNPTRGTRCRLLCGPGCVRLRTRRDNPPAATSRRTAPRRRRSRPARSPSPHVRDRSAPPARQPNRPGCVRCGPATARARSCAAWESRRCPEGSRRTPRPAPPAPVRGTDRRAAPASALSDLRRPPPRARSSPHPGRHHAARRRCAERPQPHRDPHHLFNVPARPVRRRQHTHFAPSPLRGFRLRPALCGTTGGLKQAPGALYIGSGRRGSANRTGHGSFGPRRRAAPALALCPIHWSA